jgi:hypothetical protein
MIKKVCKECNKEFEVYPYREKTAIYCSCSCRAKVSGRKNKGKKNPNGSVAKLGKNNPMFGKQFTKEHRLKISNGVREAVKRNPEKFLGKSGGDNGMWKGDNVGYDALHDWIKRQKGKAENYICSHKDKTCKGKLEWANKSGKYKRDLSDWFVFCQSPLEINHPQKDNIYR